MFIPRGTRVTRTLRELPYAPTIAPMLDDKPQALDQAFIDGMRRRIRVADIIEKMQGHILEPGKFPMSQTQIRAAEVLLKKSIPDLQQTELKASQELGAAFMAAMKRSVDDVL